MACDIERWIVLIGSVFAVWFRTAFSWAAEDPHAVLYFGGSVFTAMSDHVDATWFVVNEGRFVDVGKGEIPERWKHARFVDLRGRFVMPGFIDSHVLQADAGSAKRITDIEHEVARAAQAPGLGWVVVRNVGLEALGGRYPTHEALRTVTAAAGNRPVLLLLKGGHHVYANPAALARLGIDARSQAPEGGIIARDSSGDPTGLLVDAAAWEAVRALELQQEPETTARAIIEAQRLAIRYGITTIGDNSFFPSTAALYDKLARRSVLRLRVSLRSFGPEPMTRLAMKSLGTEPFGRPGPQVRYFGDKFFLDSAISAAGADVTGTNRLESGPRYSTEELRDFMLYSGNFGTAFHTQSRAGAERLVAARMGIRSRRAGALPDIIDHCGRCGADGLPERIREAGFHVTVLPGQLHELSLLLRDLPPSEHASLLQIRQLFLAGLKPALTSDWPFGVETSYPNLPDGFHRTGLAPLANIAVVVGGKTPEGQPIEGVESRTITMQAALLGYTAYAAKTIGREDIGSVAPDKRADFVVLPRSPFDVDPVDLYRMDPIATYINGHALGVAVEGDTAQPLPAPSQASEFTSDPSGAALAPIFGYDPVPGFLIGAAYFFYPYKPRGLRGTVQAYFSPTQMRGYAEMETTAVRQFGVVSPKIWLRANTLRERYYGVGMQTDPDVYVKTEPVRLDAALGVVVAASNEVSIGADVRGGHVHDNRAADVESLVARREGRVEGLFGGVRFELSHDTRDNTFSTRYGGKEVIWSETYGVQGGSNSLRQRIGVSVVRFTTLWAPDLILALRAEGGASVGERNYATEYTLGGSDLLRGYYSNRFRGDHYAAGSAEIRWPIFGPLSGATFGDVGRVWLTDYSNLGRFAASGGGGIRFGLPPDRLVRLRLDAGFAPDQWGIFFKFNEAF